MSSTLSVSDCACRYLNHLSRRLQELGLLKSFASTKRAALHLMCQRDVQPKLWTALGPLIQPHLKVR